MGKMVNSQKKTRNLGWIKEATKWSDVCLRIWANQLKYLEKLGCSIGHYILETPLHLNLENDFDISTKTQENQWNSTNPLLIPDIIDFIGYFSWIIFFFV